MKAVRVTTCVVETKVFELDEDELIELVRKEFGLTTAQVSFDVTGDGFLRGAVVTLTTQSQTSSEETLCPKPAR
jgi:hypothetical protein